MTRAAQAIDLSETDTRPHALLAYLRAAEELAAKLAARHTHPLDIFDAEQRLGAARRTWWEGDGEGIGIGAAA